MIEDVILSIILSILGYIFVAFELLILKELRENCNEYEDKKGLEKDEEKRTV